MLFSNTQIKLHIKLFLASLTFLSFSIIVSAQIAFQGFEGTGADNWSYISNVPLHTTPDNSTPTSADDIWNIISGQLMGYSANATVTSAKTGTFYLGGTDLDNPYSEGVTGDTTPDHYLTFDPINIAGASVDFSLWCMFEGYDSSDYIFYELAYDDGTDWSSPNVHVDIVPAPGGSNVNSSGTDWEKFTTNIPAGNTFVRLRIGVVQNGNNDFIGFDDISITPAVLSTKENIIEGFSFYPNPVENKLHFSSKVKINTIKIYSSIGQEIYAKTINSLKGEVDTVNLTSGVYFAEVTSGKSKKLVKLVKQ